MLKILVVDFDNTLCIHQTKNTLDITAGLPNIELINKLNVLYDKGFKIHIYTARGHYSSKSRKQAKEKYDLIIRSWLNTHGVKFNKLSFNKPLAIYYIDDCALRPNEFEKLDELMEKN